jgi:hypothetical protein
MSSTGTFRGTPKSGRPQSVYSESPSVAATSNIPRPKLESIHQSEASTASHSTARGKQSKRDEVCLSMDIYPTMLHPAIDTAFSRLSVPNSKRTSARSALVVTGLVRVARCRQEPCSR